MNINVKAVMLRAAAAAGILQISVPRQEASYCFDKCILVRNICDQGPNYNMSWCHVGSPGATGCIAVGCQMISDPQCNWVNSQGCS